MLGEPQIKRLLLRVACCSLLLAPPNLFAGPTSPDDHWIPVSDPVGLDGEVHTMVPYAGGLVLGGDFTTGGGVPLNHVGRWDGENFYPMGEGFDRRVVTLQTEGSRIYAGGSFDRSGADSVSCLAVWNGVGWRPLGAGFNSAVSCLTLFDDQVVAGGGFRYSGAEPSLLIPDWEPDPLEQRRFAARWDGDRWWNLGTEADLEDLGQTPKFLVEIQGDLFAGGSFRDPLNPDIRRGLAVWFNDQWVPTGPKLGFVNQGTPSLRTFARDGDVLIAGGTFDDADGARADGVIVWDGDSWYPVGSGLPGGVTAVGFHQGLPVAATSRYTRYTEVWRRTFNSWQRLGEPLNGMVRCMVNFEGNLYLGGRFDNPDEEGEVYLLVFDGTGWTPVAPPQPVLPRPVVSIQDFQGNLVVREEGSEVRKLVNGSWCGRDEASCLDGSVSLHSNHGNVALWSEFYKHPGLEVFRGDLVSVSRDKVSTWDGVEETELPETFGRTETVHAHQDRLIVGGSFTVPGAEPLCSVASWDGEAWSPLGIGIQLSPFGENDTFTRAHVRALASDGETLAAGGYFDLAGGAPTQNVAVWDGLAWYSLGKGVEGVVEALAYYKGELYAGGVISRAGDYPAVGLARWDGAFWDPMSVRTDGPVYALLVYRGLLIVGGSFQNAGDVPASNIAAWDGFGWIPLGSGVDGEVRSLHEWNGDLYVGGEFSGAGGKTAIHLARWHGVDRETMVSEFTTRRTRNGVVVRWNVDELPFDHRGFRLYREGQDGKRVLLTDALQGPAGEYVDTGVPLGSQDYWLAEETVTGRTEWIRSASVTPAPGLELTLLPNVPNPFPAAGTAIGFINDVERRVSISVYDISGREVRRLVDTVLPAGDFEFHWDGRNASGRQTPAGVYFYRLETSREVLVRKMIKTG